jgi:hypothetical protein
MEVPVLDVVNWITLRKIMEKRFATAVAGLVTTGNIVRINNLLPSELQENTPKRFKKMVNGACWEECSMLNEHWPTPVMKNERGRRSKKNLLVGEC